LIAASYAFLVAYIVVEAIRDLAGSHYPEVSWVGIGLAAVTAPTMPLLARAKRNVGRTLNSSATVSEAGQNMICAYLSIALLVGLLANALFGLVVGRPRRCARDRRGCRPRGRGEPARRNLRLLLSALKPASVSVCLIA
jgi:divalent metal cation (Fe/Co/Zn/Cd) transporter